MMDMFVLLVSPTTDPMDFAEAVGFLLLSGVAAIEKADGTRGRKLRESSWPKLESQGSAVGGTMQPCLGRPAIS